MDLSNPRQPADLRGNVLVPYLTRDRQRGRALPRVVTSETLADAAGQLRLVTHRLVALEDSHREKMILTVGFKGICQSLLAVCRTIRDEVNDDPLLQLTAGLFEGVVYVELNEPLDH